MKYPSSGAVLADDIIAIGNLTAAPNEKVSGCIAISTRDAINRQTTEIPITIVRGLQEGPTLVVLAGVHGSEYSPIAATQRLAHDLDPPLQRGTVILVHIANFPSYMGRTVYASPVDGKNLNRVFPGDRNGTLTEVIADFLVQDVYKYADAVMDLHSGDANEQLNPSYTAYYAKAGSEKVRTASRNMAMAFGTNLVVEFQWGLSSSDDHAIWAGSAAVVRGIPSIDVELSPGMGLYDPVSIEIAYRGILQVMNHLGIILRDHNDDHVNNNTIKTPTQPCIVQERHFIESPEEGSWVPLIDTGLWVPKGTLIGYITDFFGERTLFEARAPSDGLLLIRFEAPPVHKGDTVAVVAAWHTNKNPACDHYFRQTKDNSLAVASSDACIAWQLIAAAGWLVAITIFLIGKRSRDKTWRSLSDQQEEQTRLQQENTNDNEMELT